MDDTANIVKPWVTFAGCVLVVVVLYWAHAVFVPFALALLLTFVLTPSVTALERWIGRVPAVLVVVTLAFTVLGLAGWGVAQQMEHLADDLPTYRDNIRTKIADVRGGRQGRRGREAAGNDRRDQDGPGNIGGTQAGRAAIRGRHLGREGRVFGIRVARLPSSDRLERPVWCS